MIASFGNIYSTDTDSDWLTDNSVDSDFEVGPSTIPSKKRTKSSLTPPASKKSKKDSIKIPVGIDNSQRPLYECGRCEDSAVGHFDTMTNHMHDLARKCFPKKGVSCQDCTEKSPTINAVLMLNHNNELHSKLAKWACRFCGTESSQENWITHLAYYTTLKNAPKVFEGYENSDLKIGKGRYTLAYARTKADKRNAQRNSNMTPIVAINNNQSTISSEFNDLENMLVNFLAASYGQNK
jgi:hypothetical protein